MFPLLCVWLGLVAHGALATATNVSPVAVRALQLPQCDPLLPVSTDNPFGYRLRGDRCEGVYVQPVSSTPLLIASFGDLSLPDHFPAHAALHVSWPRAAGEVRLRAASLKARTYYRMDSRQRRGAASYKWSTDILSALNLAGSDIGLTAWTRQKVGERERDVYLPVRIAQPGKPQGTIQLVVVPGIELAEVYVSVSAVRKNGELQPLSQAKPLNFRFYPAGRSIAIPIDPLPAPGIYFVEIGATLPGGGAISHELWFLHAN